MSDKAHASIVALDDFNAQRDIKGVGPRARALRTVRDSAIAGLECYVTSLMDKVDDALFARAEKSESNTVQTRYFDAMRELRIIRKDIESDFLTVFKTGFDQGVQRQASSLHGLGLDTTDISASLSLVDDCDLEEELAINNMMSKIRSTCPEPGRSG